MVWIKKDLFQPKTNLDWALKYRRELKWNIIPLIPESKSPLIKWKEKYGLDERLSTEEEIKKWWSDKPEASVGMITGSLSKITVFDCDSQEALDFYKRFNLPDVPTVQSSKEYKRHFYFDNDGEIYPTFVGKNKFILKDGKLKFKDNNDKGLELDIKSEGGIVVLPPSVHKKTNKPYKWIISPFNVPLIKLNKAQIKFITAKRKIYIPTKEKFKKIRHKYNNNFNPLINDINNKVSILDVLNYVGYYMTSGKRDNLPCPMRHKHDIKSGKHSFSYNIVNNTCTCWSCCSPKEHEPGKRLGWNIWSFIQDYYNVDSKHTLEILCNIGGIDKSKYEK